MLYLLPYAMNLLGVVAIIFEGPLCNDLPSVQDSIYVMDGDAVHLDSVCNGLLYGMRATESRQQGRVDIYDAAAVGAEKDISDYPHVTRKANQVNLLPVKEFHDLFLISGLASGIGFRRKNEGRNAITFRLRDDCRPGHVADHYGHLRVYDSFGASLRYGLEIGASPTGKYCQLFHFIMISTPGASVTRPMTEAFSPCDSRMAMALSASEASSTATIPIPILKMLNISR